MILILSPPWEPHEWVKVMMNMDSFFPKIFSWDCVNEDLTGDPNSGGK